MNVNANFLSLNCTHLKIDSINFDRCIDQDYNDIMFYKVNTRSVNYCVNGVCSNISDSNKTLVEYGNTRIEFELINVIVSSDMDTGLYIVIKITSK
jgi:hypothetical protein